METVDLFYYDKFNKRNLHILTFTRIDRIIERDENKIHILYYAGCSQLKI